MDKVSDQGRLKRREWFKKIACAFIGTVSVIVPFGVGALFLLDPLRRSSQERGFTRVASLDTLPLGLPRKFTINGTRTDAWQTSPNVPIGAVYLVRREDEIEAFQGICPHAGCFVEYHPGDEQFMCPCHGSKFDLDGSVSDPYSPSPRGMDRLEVQVQANDVLVRYQEFQQGTKEKIPV